MPEDKEARDVQPSNEELPIEVTLLGMLMEVRMVQPLKALFGMEVTVLGSVTTDAQVNGSSTRGADCNAISSAIHKKRHKEITREEKNIIFRIHKT